MKKTITLIYLLTFVGSIALHTAALCVIAKHKTQETLPVVARSGEEQKHDAMNTEDERKSRLEATSTEHSEMQAASSAATSRGGVASKSAPKGSASKPIPDEGGQKQSTLDQEREELLSAEVDRREGKEGQPRAAGSPLPSITRPVRLAVKALTSEQSADAAPTDDIMWQIRPPRTLQGKAGIGVAMPQSIFSIADGFVERIVESHQGIIIAQAPEEDWIGIGNGPSLRFINVQTAKPTERRAIQQLVESCGGGTSDIVLPVEEDPLAKRLLSVANRDVPGATVRLFLSAAAGKQVLEIQRAALAKQGVRSDEDILRSEVLADLSFDAIGKLRLRVTQLILPNGAIRRARGVSND